MIIFASDRDESSCSKWSDWRFSMAKTIALRFSVGIIFNGAKQWECGILQLFSRSQRLPPPPPRPLAATPPPWRLTSTRWTTSPRQSPSWQRSAALFLSLSRRSPAPHPSFPVSADSIRYFWLIFLQLWIFILFKICTFFYLTTSKATKYFLNFSPSHLGIMLSFSFFFEIFDECYSLQRKQRL